MKSNNVSFGENHNVTLSNPKKVKRKDTFDNENLSEAPEDGRFNTLPIKLYEEKSSMLIEETIKTNIGTKEVPYNIFLAQSLTKIERPS